MDRTTVGVAGAGVMGADVALLLACHGHSVLLHDIAPGALQAFEDGLKAALRGWRLLGAELPTSDLAEVRSRVRCSSDASILGDARWVVECVTEDLGTKEGVYRALREICRPDTYYAVNTSCIPITRLAALMPQPERVLGLHFMNPVPLKHTVEAVQGFHTSPETLQAARDFLGSIGRSAIVVQDQAGFVANRLSHLFMNEAAFLVQEGIASPAAIDAIFREGYGHRMGPLETADLIGLDTVMRSLDVLYQHHQDPKFRCCPLLRKMVDAGVTGKKARRGFHEYRD